MAGRLVILVEAVKTTSFLLRYNFGTNSEMSRSFSILGFVDLQELVIVKFFVF